MFSCVLLFIAVLVLGETFFVTAQYVWAAWGTWSSCSQTCGLGTQRRYRTCKFLPPELQDIIVDWQQPPILVNPVNPPRSKRSLDLCLGSNSETQQCQIQDCPLNGQWGSWSSYGPCSKTCGDGTRTRTRTCDNPAPANGGADCFGSSSETATCNLQECPVNGQWGVWGSYGQCSKTCGDGTRTRTRTCDNPGGAGCLGSSSETAACNLQECPVNGQWGVWGSYGQCSKTCGDGTRTRTRTCDSPAPENGGLGCTGSETETEACVDDPCSCPQGRYGTDCSQVCSDGCYLQICRNTDGHCSCTEGWTGDRCDQEIEATTTSTSTATTTAMATATTTATVTATSTNEAGGQTQETPESKPVAAIAGGAASAAVVAIVVVVIIVVVVVRRRRKRNENDHVAKETSNTVDDVQVSAKDQGPDFEDTEYAEIDERAVNDDQGGRSAPVHVDPNGTKAQYYNTGKAGSKAAAASTTAAVGAAATAAASSAGVYEDVGFPSSSVYDKANVYENRKEEGVYTKLRKI